MRKILFFLALWIGGWGIFAQSGKDDKETIEIVHADKLILDEKYPGLKLLVGNVILKHKNAVLTSDKALVDLEENFAEAIDNVTLTHEDTLTLKSGIVRYDGNSEMAFAIDRVWLTDPQMQLQTDTLYYDLKDKKAWYTSGGIIRDSVNVLESKAGYYFVDEQLYEFMGNVRITNPDYRIFSARLDYNTAAKTARFYGPTKITDDKGFIYAEKGFYDTRNDIAWFTRNAYMESGASSLKADSVYMDKNREFYSASGHVRMNDTVRKTMVLAGYAEQWKAQDSVYLRDKPVVISYEQKDTLYIAARQMIMRGEKDAREFFAYPAVRFYREGFSGRADSLYRSEIKRNIELHRFPVIWTEDSQITGDSIIIQYDTLGQNPDSLFIPSGVFIIQQDSAGYNQIKGNDLKGKFRDGKLRYIQIVGNTEMIYHVRDEKDNLVGIDRSICSRMEMFLDEEGKMEKVILRDQPQGTTYPPDEFPQALKILDGFQWLGDRRITSAEELLEGEKAEFEKPRMKPVRSEDKPPPVKLPEKLFKGL